MIACTCSFLIRSTAAQTKNGNAFFRLEMMTHKHLGPKENRAVLGHKLYWRQETFSSSNE